MIYLDNNATTKVDPRVLEAMMPYLTDNFANAASTHPFGLGAYEAVKNARQQVADLIGSETNEIIFTSGATEAINLAIKGVAENYSKKGKHIITVSTEHKAILDTCEFLDTKGFEVTYLPVQSDGLLDLQVLKQAIRPDTILVSVMLVNNEIGVIQPIKEIAEIAHETGALFMTDATQAVGKIKVDVDELGIDLMCFSGHKMYAPKGIGALFVRQRRPRRVKLEALIHGGGHERSLRSGTLNVPGIIALGKACEIAKNEMSENQDKIKELRDYLEAELLKIDDTIVNGNQNQRIFSTSNILFKGVDSDAIIMGLDGIAVSNGSACTSASIEPSHVLIELGYSEEDAFSSIRFSIGKTNTIEEILFVISKLKNLICQLRALNGL
ncbi:cysteine desulfurase family protein [Pontibacter cellulosilyticus]|uniref:cysteine desulfurase n=1 Tax=Pontibacter cellulosilyticus TaxID=1720253 RepID=A0A923SH68_9BACT|nr:cysteine desulfurase family protein [Pontibacter cellulosilyticus]MBC5991419.1 cysteine desulfurase [Pontibacter cellulosilyticus]